MTASNTITPRTPRLLAWAFAFKLREALDPEEMAQVVARNEQHRANGQNHVCASHDFCDANMVMDEAVKMIGLQTFDEDGNIDDAVTDAWNAAWDIAKASGFAVPQYMREFPDYGPDLGLDLPPGWEDASWGSAACPDFVCGNYRLIVGYADSEGRLDPYDGRYAVVQYADGQTGEVLFNTDVVREIRDFVTMIALRVELEEWRAMQAGRMVEREGLDELCAYADAAINATGQ